MTLLRARPEPKEFVPGTTGWTAADLDDPRIEREWLRGSYEIVEGVLSIMPPAYFAGGSALFNLMHLVQSHLRDNTPDKGAFSIEVDVVIDTHRVAKADAVYLSRPDKVRQTRAARRAGRTNLLRTRILVSPTLIIESVSPGHERHDEQTKRDWYAEFGVPHYWLLDGFERVLRCLVLEGGAYRVDTAGRGKGQVRPTLFPGLTIRLGELWDV